MRRSWIVITLLGVLITLGFTNCAPTVTTEDAATAKKTTSTATTTSATTSTRVKINTGTGWSDSPFISRDGKRLYFMYSRYHFGTWIRTGGATAPPLTGPDRPGLHHDLTNPFSESDIYMATKNPDGTWSEPVNMGFNGDHGDAGGMELDNGDTFLWQSTHGGNVKIVMAHKNPDGTWSAPTDLGGLGRGSSFINDTDSMQDNPHMNPAKNMLWFSSTRSGGVTGAGGSGVTHKKDIWFSQLVNGLWSAPINVNSLGGFPVNTIGEDDQPFISPVSNDVYWNSADQGGIMHCVSNGTNCPTTGPGAPARIAIPGCAISAEVSMPDDGQTMYYACVDITTFNISINYSVKQRDGSWGPSTPVD